MEKFICFPHRLRTSSSKPIFLNVDSVEELSVEYVGNYFVNEWYDENYLWPIIPFKVFLTLESDFNGWEMHSLRSWCKTVRETITYNYKHRNKKKSISHTIPTCMIYFIHNNKNRESFEGYKYYGCYPILIETINDNPNKLMITFYATSCHHKIRDDEMGAILKYTKQYIMGLTLLYGEQKL